MLQCLCCWRRPGTRCRLVFVTGRSWNRKPSTDLGGGVLYLGSFFRKYPNHVQKILQRKWVPFYPFTKPHQSPQTEVKWKKLRKGHGRLLKHIHLITRDFLYPETSTDFTFQTHFVRHWDNSGFPTETLFIPTQNNPPPKQVCLFPGSKANSHWQKLRHLMGKPNEKAGFLEIYLFCYAKICFAVNFVWNLLPHEPKKVELFQPALIAGKGTGVFLIQER